ncbi:Ig-like domain-containing protein [Omnitrophica bacterium]|nr:Ig-like domain-containing protein [Candidatus Omnitrophota bacterium]
MRSLRIKAARPVVPLRMAQAAVFFISIAVFFMFHSPLAYCGKEETRNATNELLVTYKKFEKASPGIRRTLLKEMKEKAEKRQGQMIEQAQTDPQEFLRQSLPGKLVKRMPEEVREHLEQDAEVRGKLRAFWLDNFEEPEKSKLVHQLENENDPKEVINLHFAQDPPDLPDGSHVIARGKKIGHEMVLERGKSKKTVVGAANSSGESTESLQTVSSAPAAAVSGDQKTIVLRVDFQDKPTACTVEGIDNLMFSGSSSVDLYYQESSFGNITFSGDVKGPFTIPYNNTTTCDYYNWAYAADDAATAAGVDLMQYQRRIYVLPTSCNGWAGLGTIGGYPSRVWVLGYCSTPDIYAHELGHNLNMRHASTDACEYCDYSCIMGYGAVGLRHPNGPHKAQMGWIPPERIQTVSANGLYTISAEEQFLGGIQAVRIPKADTGEYFYLSFRVPTGFDTVLRSAYQNRTSVHRWNEASNTYFLKALADNETFNDTANAVTVTQVSHSPSSATLSIDIGQPACQTVNPLVMLSPLSQTHSSGKTLDYTVTVYNEDGFACPDASFYFTSSLAPGWSSTMSPATITLSQGTSGTATWSVTSAADAPDGIYPVEITAIDNADSNHKATASASYVVFTDNTGPEVFISNPLDGTEITDRKVPILARAQDNLGITQMEIVIDGKGVATGTTSTLSYNWLAFKSTAGHHTILARAWDTAGNEASTSIVVYIPEKPEKKPPPGKNKKK